MEVKVINEAGLESSSIEVRDEIFQSTVNKSVLYEAIKNELANKRQGTASTKSRGEVSGGTSKPWRQKGTGRARAGTRRSPIWVGGGKVHTPRPRDYSYRLPRKVKQFAFRSVFSMHHKNESVRIIEDFAFEAPKTKRMAEFVHSHKKDGTRKVVFVVGKSEELGANYTNLLLSLRNIKDVKLVNADALSVHPLFYADEVFITKTAMLKLNEHMAKKAKKGVPNG